MRYRSIAWVLVVAAAVSAALAGPGAESAYGMRPAQCLARWHSVPFPLRGHVSFGDVAVHGRHAWALGNAEDRAVIERWQRPSWSRMPAPALSAYEHLDAITALAPDDIWVVGGRSTDTDDGPEGPISFHWDGRRWTRFFVPRAIVDPTFGGGGGYLNDISGLSSDDVWAVGDGHELANDASEGLIVHWNGHRWTRDPMVEIYLSAVSSGLEGAVWTVGWDASFFTQPEAMVHTAGTWSAVYANQDDAQAWLVDVAAGGSAVWAVGGWFTADASGPLIERYESGELRIVPVQGTYTGDLSGVTEIGAHAFAVGTWQGPVIERFRNGTWGPMHIPAGWADRSLGSIAAGPDGSVWAVGSFIARSCIGPV